MPDARIDLFACAAPAACANQLLETADASALMDELLGRARGATPFAIADEIFLPYVASRLAEDATLASLEALHAADLFLACACAHGDRHALAAFERDFMPDIGHAIAKVAKDHARRDDVAQMLRSRLFVAEPGQLPRIADYSGRGRLFSWLRVVAVRETLSLLRKGKREFLVGDAIPEEAIDDFEVGVFRGLYQREFKAAFEAALAALSAKERTLLRLHLVDRLSVDQIGAAHGVHRTSAARWLRDVRGKLALETRDRLSASLKLGDDELESVMRLVRSRLELSISRLLEVA